jgi:protein-L-isoaspartate(D-aspartate) O-methyltransferase
VCGASAAGDQTPKSRPKRSAGRRIAFPRIVFPVLIAIAVAAVVVLLLDPFKTKAPTADLASAGAPQASAETAASNRPNGSATPGVSDQGFASPDPAVSPSGQTTAAGVTDSPWPKVLDTMPTTSKEAYIAWMQGHSDETAHFLEQKWQRAQILVNNKDITSPSLLRAFLFTPREYFVRKYNLKQAYDNTAIPIGYGQTISGPHMVTNMTQSLDVQRGDRVLEIGTGSGYQSALLSELTSHVYTIEIVPQLYRDTDAIYTKLSTRYPEYNSILRKNADGYYGWAEYAPFQKIIVTAGIDHIPPDLLKQLAPDGVMVIPIGPPSGQTVLRIVKKPLPGGGFTFERSDIYHGTKVIFVPFTSTEGTRHSVDTSGAGSGQ